MNRAILLTAVLTAVAGCNSTLTKSVNSKMPWAEKEPELIESEFDRPTRIVAIWSDAILNQPGSPPIRGFGGRIYFYNAHNKAVPVEGQLVVYGYEEAENTKTASKTPDKKFVFTPSQLANQFSPSDLGASYNIWIPWEPVGGNRKSISLLPVFTASDGQIVAGRQSLNVLPGKSADVQRTDDKGRFTPVDTATHGQYGDVKQVVYQTAHDFKRQPTTAERHPSDDQRTESERLRTTTIRLPMSMQRRLELTAAKNESPAIDAGTPSASAAYANQREETTSEPRVLRSPVSDGSPSSATSSHSSVSPPAAPTATSYRQHQRSPSGWPSLPGTRRIPAPSNLQENAQTTVSSNW